MADKTFVNGFYFKVKETQYGEIIKLGINIQQFFEFVKKHKDGEYLNIDILRSKETNKPYAVLDTFKPFKVGDFTEPAEDNIGGSDLPF